MPLNGIYHVEAGTPDVMGMWRGVQFFIEVKVDGEDPSKIQRKRMDEWQSVGALVAVGREDFDAGEFLSMADRFEPVI